MLMLRLLWLVMLIVNMSCQSAHKVKASLLNSSIDKAVRFTTIDGKALSLPELSSEKKGAVLIFWQRSCPCVKRYQARVNSLFQQYGEKLAFYHVSSSLHEPFSLVKAEYARRLIPLPLLHDEGARLKKALDVRGTPSAALFNERGELIYIGWIDNERMPGERGRSAYLEDAVRQHLQDQTISTSSSPMFGCPIR